MLFRYTRYTFIFLIFLLSACSGNDYQGVTLQYIVRLVPDDNQNISVSMSILGANKGPIILTQHTYSEFVPITDCIAGDFSKKQIKVTRIENSRKLATQKITKTSFKIENDKEKNIQVHYSVKIGQIIHEKHGSQSYHTYGYLGTDFGLFSGRSLFLTPDVNVNKIQVRFEKPDGWIMSTPWENNQGWLELKGTGMFLIEDLVNSVLCLGELECKKQLIGETEVSVYSYMGWSKTNRELISQQAFAIYQRVRELFGGDGGGKYAFHFVPKTDENLHITVGNWFSGQGSDFDNPSSIAWLMCIEQLLERWLQFPPYRMEYQKVTDFWLVEGVKGYYGAQIAIDLNLIDRQEILEILETNFKTSISDRTLESVLFPAEKPQLAKPPKDIKGLYESKSQAMEKLRQRLAPFIAYNVDKRLKKLTDGKIVLKDILKHEYKKKTKLDFLEDIERLAGPDVKKKIEEALSDLQSIAQEEGLIKPAPKPKDRLISKNLATDTLRIVFTGNTRGFLENCGCKLNQSGGIARRAHVVKITREMFPDVVVIDAGNFFPSDRKIYRMTDYLEGQLHIYLNAMKKIRVDAVGIAFNELFFGPGVLTEYLEEVGIPVVSCNIHVNEKKLVKPYTILQANGIKIAIIGVTEPKAIFENKRQYREFEERNRSTHFEDPINAVRKTVGELATSVDYIALIGLMSPGLIDELTNKVENIDMIFSTEPGWNRLTKLDDKLTLYRYDTSGFQNEILIVYDYNALYAVDLLEIALDRNSHKVIGFNKKRISLDDGIPEDSEVRKLIDDFYSQFTETKGELQKQVSWDSSRLPFVGSDACKVCHQEQYIQWKTTKHAQAFNVLLDAKRHFQPKCVSCHITGAGYDGGYRMGDLTHPMMHVQCEACHGPGGKHILAPSKSSILGKPKADLCIRCHDQDHSDFVFNEYYPKVIH